MELNERTKCRMQPIRNNKLPTLESVCLLSPSYQRIQRVAVKVLIVMRARMTQIQENIRDFRVGEV